MFLFSVLCHFNHHWLKRFIHHSIFHLLVRSRSVFCSFFSPFVNINSWRVGFFSAEGGLLYAIYSCHLLVNLLVYMFTFIDIRRCRERVCTLCNFVIAPRCCCCCCCCSRCSVKIRPCLIRCCSFMSCLWLTMRKEKIAKVETKQCHAVNYECICVFCTYPLSIIRLNRLMVKLKSSKTNTNIFSPRLDCCLLRSIAKKV